MNVMLFDRQINPSLFEMNADQVRHARKVLRAKEGDSLQVGLVNGPIGRAVVETLNRNECVLRLERWVQESSPVRPWRIVIALPRPPVFRRVLQLIGSLSLQHIVITNSARVEKSYWDSHVVDDETIAHNIRLGMEQGVTTHQPKVECVCQFQELLAWVDQGYIVDENFWMIHPSTEAQMGFGPLHASDGGAQTLMIGPEGGWTDGEVEQLKLRGASLVSLGPNILKVESAVAYVMGMIQP